MTRTADPFDELAAMFLTQPDQSGDGGEPAASQAVIEALVVGHLPVRAGLWLTPYADVVAREIGPVVLLRLDRDEPIVQVLRGNADATPPAGRTLTETIRAIAPHVAGWIVYAGSASHAELIRQAPDRVTILSSADDAAVVAAYQHVKHLVSAAEDEQTRLPAVNLAVLGADETAATRVFDRVNRTTTAFLGVELDLSSVIQRMDAAVRSTSYVSFTGEQSPAVADAIRLIDEARRRPAPPRPSQQDDGATLAEQTVGAGDAEPTPTRLSTDEREMLHQPTSTPPKPTTPPAPAAQQPDGDDAQNGAAEPPLVEYVAYAEPRQSRITQQQRQQADARQRRPARVVPRPYVEVEPKQPEVAREPDDHGQPVPLASYVEDLTPIAPRCPGRERIELAVGRFGRVHLLGREDVLRDMRYVESWVRSHVELLAMACPDVTIDPGTRPMCHVFTDKPAALADLHGCDVKLHVLAPVQVNGSTGWYAAPLN